MIETNISLENLSLDEIIKKFKALKNDRTIVSMTLSVKRNQPHVYSKIKKQKSYDLNKYNMNGPNNVNNLLRARKLNSTEKNLIQHDGVNEEEVKDSVEENAQLQQGQPAIQNKQETIQTRQQVFISKYTSNNQSLSFVKDKRLSKAIKYYNTANYDEAIRNLLEIYEELEDKLSNYSSDTQKLNKTQKTSEQIKRNIANVSFHIGNCYVKKKNYDKALQFYLITFQEEGPKQRGIRSGNIAACYAYQKKNQLSLSQYKQALKLLSEFQEIDLSNIYYNIGNIYLEEEMYDTSIKYFKLSVDQRKQKSPDNQDMLYNTYYKMGIALRGEKQIQQSLNCFTLALTYAERGVSSSNNSINEVCMQIALCHEILKKWNDAFAIYENMLNILEDDSKYKAYIYRRVASIYRKGGNDNQYKKYLKLAADEYETKGIITAEKFI